MPSSVNWQEKPVKPEDEAVSSENWYWLSSLPDVLEGIHFPASKNDIIASIGCEELDLEEGEAISICDFAKKLPDREYKSVGDVLDELFGEFRAA
ncbi:MAG: DUF2795 domain-containing protein [Firmicutes bacterium]|nr:DUF2795 domain-containing protein [Bacillota bacterium]